MTATCFGDFILENLVHCVVLFILSLCLPLSVSFAYPGE